MGSGLNGMTFAPGGAVWAVGASASPASERTLIMRWSGRAWTQIASPDSGDNDQLYAVAFASASSGWAVGYDGSFSSVTTQTMILHWNGKAWN
jgi:hypothetical protein